MRDQLLGLGQPSKDLDLVVEGPRHWPALELKAAIEQASSLPKGFVLQISQGFEAFGTAQLQLLTPTGHCFAISAQHALSITPSPAPIPA